MTNIKFSIITILILLVLPISISAQISDKIFLEGDAVSKFSIGKETRKNIEYQDNVTANVPDKAKFDSPVLGLNFSLNYQINESFSSGIGSGINVVQNENHPVISNEYYDKVLFPLFARFRFQKDFSQTWHALADINAGYQFSDFEYGNSSEGFSFQEKGGLLANLDLGIGKDLGRYTPILKLGYELNQFDHENSLGWLDESLEYDDKIEYKTYYHFLKLSVSIQL